jgi:hypothetical protein
MNHPKAPVLRYSDSDTRSVAALLARFGLRIRLQDDDRPIEGSYWGGEEAGLVGRDVVVRAGTPVHSILHEACHYVCMDEARRRGLHTDAGGDYDEENAVCYLQILLADEIPGFGHERMMADMEAWGYSFRLGSARAWFHRDAADAREWLQGRGLLSADGGALLPPISERQ